MAEESFYGVTLSGQNAVVDWDVPTDKEYPRAQKLIIKQILLGADAAEGEFNVVELIQGNGPVYIHGTHLKDELETVGGIMDEDTDEEDVLVDTQLTRESRPSKLPRHACTKMLPLIAVGTGIHADDMVGERLVASALGHVVIGLKSPVTSSYPLGKTKLPGEILCRSTEAKTKTTNRNMTQKENSRNRGIY